MGLLANLTGAEPLYKPGWNQSQPHYQWIDRCYFSPSFCHRKSPAVAPLPSNHIRTSPAALLPTITSMRLLESYPERSYAKLRIIRP